MSVVMLLRKLLTLSSMFEVKLNGSQLILRLEGSRVW